MNIADISLKFPLPKSGLEEDMFFANIDTHFVTTLKKLEAKNTIRDSGEILEYQSDINSTMRKILLDWLFEISQHMKLLPETYCLTVYLLDTVLRLYKIHRGVLQLTGCVCSMLACKWEESTVPTIDDYVYVSDMCFTRSEFKYFEVGVLNILGHDLWVAKPIDFVYLNTFGFDNELKSIIEYLIILSLFEVSIQTLSPSVVAASVIRIACDMTSVTPPSYFKDDEVATKLLRKTLAKAHYCKWCYNVYKLYTYNKYHNVSKRIDIKFSKIT